LVGGDRIAFDDEVGGWGDGCRLHRAEADVDGVGEEARHAFWEVLPLVEAIKVHEEP
jgi:hypothetical protein